MATPILKLLGIQRRVTTHTVGLLQAKAYRILKHTTNDALKDFHISPLEWSFLGLLHDQPKGLRARELAELLGVEPPFITVVVKKLKLQKMLNIIVDPADKRAKVISLSKTGEKFIPKVEAHLRSVTDPLIKGLNRLELLAYIKVLHTIVRNHERISPRN